MIPLIGITGYARHGKDTVGGLLALRGYHRMAFADKVKEMAYAIDPIITLSDGSSTLLASYVDKVGWEVAKAVPEVRRLLQRIGTEGGRDVFGEDVWVNALEREYWKYQGNTPQIEEHQHRHVVITDVRFPNEVDFIHVYGGVVLRVVRGRYTNESQHPGYDLAEFVPFDNGMDKSHPSEKNIATLQADATVRNYGTLEALATEVAAVLERIEDAGVASTVQAAATERQAVHAEAPYHGPRTFHP